MYYRVLESYADLMYLDPRFYQNLTCTFIAQVKQVSEDTKFLWGRRDDESCLEKLKDNLNSTSLAEYCGIFSR